MENDDLRHDSTGAFVKKKEKKKEKTLECNKDHFIVSKSFFSVFQVMAYMRNIIIQ